jgi:hypothetical protein
MMATEIKRRGSIIYIREPHIFKTITPRLKKIEKKLEYIEKKGEKLIHEEERKKTGILPKIIRFEEKISRSMGESERALSESLKQSRIRQAQRQVNEFVKNVKSLNYDQLLNQLKRLNEEYQDVKSREIELKRKKTPIEKFGEILGGGEPMDKDELRAFEKSHIIMKKALLENIIKKKREIKRLGKII